MELDSNMDVYPLFRLKIWSGAFFTLKGSHTVAAFPFLNKLAVLQKK